MTIGESRDLFGALLPRLLDKALALGYGVRPGELLRSDEQAAINALGEAGRSALCVLLETDQRFHALALAISNNGKGNGILMSLHREGLAVDLNLIRKDATLGTPADHAPLGQYWKGLHELARWGGDFNDANHYSIEFQGRK